MGGSSRSYEAISIHCCLGTTNFSSEGQCQGHKGEDKKDQEYHYTFGNKANDINQGGVILTAKP
jgi:hypothetical protein